MHKHTHITHAHVYIYIFSQTGYNYSINIKFTFLIRWYLKKSVKMSNEILITNGYSLSDFNLPRIISYQFEQNNETEINYF